LPSFKRLINAGPTAALIEQERPNLFTNSVANIGPHKRVIAENEYQQVLTIRCRSIHTCG